MEVRQVAQQKRDVTLHLKKENREYKSAAAESMRKNLNVIFTKVNTDNNPSLTNYFGVNTFPRLLLFKPGDFERPRRFVFSLPKYLDV